MRDNREKRTVKYNKTMILSKFAAKKKSNFSLAEND